MNLVYYGFNRTDFDPQKDSEGNVTTFCNKFVQYVLNGFNYIAMTGMTANEMNQFMADPKNGWITLDEVNAQARANEGVIVIPGWFNPNGHGHVNVVIPGLLENSETFHKKVPKCVNIGVVNFIGKKISWAFKPEEAPTYYAFASQI